VIHAVSPRGARTIPFSELESRNARRLRHLQDGGRGTPLAQTGRERSRASLRFRQHGADRPPPGERGSLRRR
jgi:hypothetical protein